MKNNSQISILLLFFIVLVQLSYSQDWANINQYKMENGKLGLPSINESRVVFMGNSITEGWSTLSPDFFEGKTYINRGIGGQTTPQMLLRFRSDVIALKPKVVVILGGTNDIAGNTGPMTLKMILDNIISMCEIAKSNDIKVIISSVLPAYDFPWRPGMHPDKKIPKLNMMLKSYAKNNDIFYLDYYSSMVDEKNGLKKEYGHDGVHPNLKGYKIMEEIIEKALVKVLKK